VVSALLRPLILTGGPAVGKSSTGRLLCSARSRAAFVDVDDVRQMILTGHVPPWRGPEGHRQQRLGVANACDIAGRLHAAGFDVVVADVVTPDTARVYRRELPNCLIVHLVVLRAEAVRRARTRRVWLTDEEFEALHQADQDVPPPADHRLDVRALRLEDQAAAVQSLWSA
jgi:hypothetical protein